MNRNIQSQKCKLTERERISTILITFYSCFLDKNGIEKEKAYLNDFRLAGKRKKANTMKKEGKLKSNKERKMKEKVRTD